MGERGATVSVLNRGVLPRRGQETPSSKLLAANRTEGGRQRADGQGSNRGVRRIWLHKCTGPRKRRDTEKDTGEASVSGGRAAAGRAVYPVVPVWGLVAGRAKRHMPDTSHRGVRAFVATAQVNKCGGGVEHEAGRPGGGQAHISLTPLGGRA